jgi:acyl carrier protein
MSIAEEIIELVMRAAPDRCQGVRLNEDTDMVADLGMPSIELIRVFSAIEGRFDLDLFDVARSERVTTLGDLVRLVHAKRGERA